MAGLLYKVAARSSTTRDIAHLTGAAAATGLAIAGVDKGLDYMGDKFFEAKIPNLIRYAKKKHPDLSSVGDAKLKHWVKALYTLSPKYASDPELAADALYQIHQYGGNIDLATAKMMADINRGVSSNKDDNVKYISTGASIAATR